MATLRSIRWTLLPAVAVLLLATSIHADSPAGPPEKTSIWSGNRFYRADMDPETNLTTVYFVDGDREKKLWSMIGWFWMAELAGDGEHMIVGTDGGPAVPAKAGPDHILIYFVKRGEVIGTVTLGEVVKRRSSMPKTASHRIWGEYLGIDEDNRLRIKTCEGVTMWFDVTTGNLIRQEREGPSQPHLPLGPFRRADDRP